MLDLPLHGLSVVVSLSEYCKIPEGSSNPQQQGTGGGTRLPHGACKYILTHFFHLLN